MHRTWTIVKREYRTRVRTLRFVLGTILTPLIMGAWILAPTYFASKNVGQREVFVLDQTGGRTFFDALTAEMATAPDGDVRTRPKHLDSMFRLHYEPQSPQSNLERARRRYETRDQGDRETVLLLVPADAVRTANPVYVGATLSDPAINDFERAVDTAILRWRLTQAGLPGREAQTMVRSAPMKRERMQMVGRVSGDDAESVATFMLVTMYTVTFLYGVWMMRGVASEKRSRIAEVLLTIVKPVELMTGKLVGIGLVGLTQCLIWVVAAVLLVLCGPLLSLPGFDLPRVSFDILGYFLAYFLLGYFLYAVLFALAGACSTNTDDANFIQQPLILLTITPLFVFLMVLRDPNGPASVVLSLVPFFSPTIMLLRLTVSNPPLWQVILSFVLMLAGLVICLWITAKAYRAGILMSGKRQNFGELVRWLRYA